MTFDANGKLLDGNDGGIWRLQTPPPAPSPGHDLNTNLSTLQFNGIGLDPTDPNIAYGGTQDNGTRSSPASLPWNSDPRAATAASSAWTPPTPTRSTTRSSARRAARRSIAALRRRRRHLDRHQPRHQPQRPSRISIVPYQMDPSNPSRLILGTDHLYESLNKGDQLDDHRHARRSGFAINNTIDAIGAVQDGPQHHLRRRRPATSSSPSTTAPAWIKRNIPGVTDHINDLVVDPTNSRRLRRARPFGGGKVFHTTDGGHDLDRHQRQPARPAHVLAGHGHDEQYPLCRQRQRRSSPRTTARPGASGRACLTSKCGNWC